MRADGGAWLCLAAIRTMVQHAFGRSALGHTPLEHVKCSRAKDEQGMTAREDRMW